MSNSHSFANSEESSWTFYLQDFFAGESSIGDYSWGYSEMSHDGSSTSSMISDAASVAAWRIAKKSSCKKLSLKKRIRTRKGFEDDDLADTASSPVNSPKIGEQVKHLEMVNPSKTVRSDITHVQQEINTNAGECSQLLGMTTDITGKGYGGEAAGSECNELRKRGLCVVPLSIFRNAV